MKGSLIILFFTAVLLNMDCSNSTDVKPEADRWLTGTVKDTSGSPLTDVQVFLIYHFDTYPMDAAGNGRLVVKDSIPDKSTLSQNHPNPFVSNSFFEYGLRKTSNITIGIYDFNKNLVAPDYIKKDSVSPGFYGGAIGNRYPSGGYKLIMDVDEMGDSLYKLETDFMITYPYPSIYVKTTTPNTVTSDGVFKINYNDIPFGRQYIHIPEFHTTPDSIFEVNNTLTIVLYSYYHQPVMQDVILNPQVSRDLDFVMQ